MERNYIKLTISCVLTAVILFSVSPFSAFAKGTPTDITEKNISVRENAVKSAPLEKEKNTEEIFEYSNSENVSDNAIDGLYNGDGVTRGEAYAQTDKSETSNLPTENKLYGFDIYNQINYISYSHTDESGFTANTKEEYIYNCTHGYTSIKGDMCLTSDGEIIMCHDKGVTFDKESGKIVKYDPNSSSTVNIADKPYSFWMSKQYADGSDVCDFETYVLVCKLFKKIPFITLRQQNDLMLDKDDNTEKQAHIITIKKMLEILDKYEMRKNSIINSTNYTPLWELRKHFDPTITMAFSYGKIISSDNKLRIDQASNPKQLGGNCIVVGGIGDDINNLDFKFDDGNGKQVTSLEYAKQKGVAYYCYFAKTAQDVSDAVSKGVMGMQMMCEVPDDSMEPPAKPELKPVSLILDKKPTKISYELNEEFDPDGAVLRLKYEDGTIKPLTTDEVEAVGFDTTTPGTHKVHFSYTENGVTLNTWEFTHLVDRQVNNIYIPKKPDKTTYVMGEPFDKTGMQIIATYTDGSKADVTKAVRTSGYESTSSGLKKMTVSYTYKDKTVTLQFSYQMNPKLTGITITKKPDKLSTYKVGEPLSKEGMIVTASFSDGTTKDVTHLIRTSGYSSKQVGKQIITVSYTYGTRTKSVQFSIIMNE